MIDGVVITFFNITLIKQAEHLKYLASIVLTSNDAISVQDFNGQITAWNQGAVRMCGYTEAQALKMNIRDFVPEHKKEEALNFIALSTTEKIDSFQTQCITNTGKILDVWMKVSILTDSTGKAVAVSTSERDISELERIRKRDGENS